MHFAGFSDKKISISQLMAESDTARYKWGSQKVAYIQRLIAWEKDLQSGQDLDRVFLIFCQLGSCLM